MEEISQLVSHSHDPAETLDNIMVRIFGLGSGTISGCLSDDSGGHCVSPAIDLVILGASGGAAFPALCLAMTAVLAIPILGEWPTAIDWIAIILISAGVYVVSGGPLPGRRGADVGEARALHKLVHAQGRLGYEGHVQGEHALAKLEHGYKEGRDPYGPGSFPRPYLPGEEGEG